jgi:F-type H+-transporting ATPase subunit delta
MSEQIQVRHVTVMDDESRLVARVYAEALYKAAEQQHLAEEVNNELTELVEGVFRRDPGMELFFASASINETRKAEAIEKAFRGRASDVLTKFLLVLNHHGRLDKVRAVAETYHRLHNQKTRRVVVHAISAVPLTDDERRRVCDDVREVAQIEPILQERVDPELLGGLIVRVGDWVYDASVRARIDQALHQLIERSSHAVASR